MKRKLHKMKKVSEIKKVLPVWHAMTNSNQHNIRCYSIAIFFQKDIGTIFYKLFEDIMKAHLEIGQMPLWLCEIRNEIDKQMINEIARIYGKDIAKLIED